MTVGSLFAGIGGFDLGFERAGYDIRWQVEIDPWARAVLAKHWPHVHRHDDIRTAGAHNIEAVDVLCGGFPCTDISLAGKGAGITGPQSGLWAEYARLIRELRPRYVVVENVAALLARGLGRVLGDLAACGYDAEWDCIPAAAVGAPHRRDRLWLIAYPSVTRCVWRPGRDCESHRRGERSSGVDVDRRREGSYPHVADALHDGREERALSEGQGREAIPDAARCGGTAPNVADTNQPRLEGRISAGVRERAGERVAWPSGARIFTERPTGIWQPEPNVGRVAHGVPARVDRLRGLGNAIVPQIAEWIARRILEAEARRVAA